MSSGVIESTFIDTLTATRQHGNNNQILSGFQRSITYTPISTIHISPSEVKGDGVVKGGEVASSTAAAQDPYLVLILEFVGRPVEGKVLEEMVQKVAEAGFRGSVRRYELVGSEGFGGKCRVPERLPQKKT